MDQPPPEPMPSHPEEMKATYDLRIGKSVSLQGTARITPAGVITMGLAAAAIILAVAALVSASRPRPGAIERLAALGRLPSRRRPSI